MQAMYASLSFFECTQTVGCVPRSRLRLGIGCGTAGLQGVSARLDAPMQAFCCSHLGLLAGYKCDVVYAL